MFQQINNNIIKTLGIDSLPEEKQREAVERLGSIVYQEVMLRVLDIMSEEDKDKFEKLIEISPDPEIMFTFIGEKVPNLEDIINEEAQKLRDEATEILGDIGK